MHICIIFDQHALNCSDPVTLGHFSRINVPHLQVLKSQDVEVSVETVDYEF